MSDHSLTQKKKRKKSEGKKGREEGREEGREGGREEEVIIFIFKNKEMHH